MSDLVFPTIATADLRMIPQYLTTVSKYTGGQEQRIMRHLVPTFRFEIGAEPLVLQAAWQTLDAFYHRHRARFETFKFQDWTVTAGAAAKNRTGEQLGVGNGDLTEFYLFENVVDSAIIYANGAPVSQAGATPDVAVDETTGLVVFNAAPAAGVVITADVTNAYFRLRFDMDEIEWDRVRGAGWRGRIALVQPNRATG